MCLGCFVRFIFIQLIVLLRPDSNCLSSFTLSWVDRVTTGTYGFVSVTLNFGTRFAAVPAIKNVL